MKFQESVNARCRMELLRICVVFAAMGTLAEIAIYKYDAMHRTLFLEGRLYKFRFIYIPSGLNLAIILITYFCLKSKKLSNKAKNVWACLLIYFLCADIQVAHYVYGPLMMLPCVAIFMTVLFGDKRITTLSFGLSYVSLAIASMLASVELRKGDPQLPTDVALTVIVMFVTYMGSRLLINYVSEQTNYILASNARQKLLIEECNMDELMGIGNRRSLDERISEVIFSEHSEKKLQLFMLDIDDFKEVNDTYGHINGDEVLIKLGDILSDIEGDGSIEAFRYGGEEIVVLMMNMDIQEAVRIAKEVLNDFSGLSFTFNSKIRITFSGGIAEYEAGMTQEQWIEKADMKLYIAKKNGKNRIEA